MFTEAKLSVNNPKTCSYSNRYNMIMTTLEPDKVERPLQFHTGLINPSFTFIF